MFLHNMPIDYIIYISNYLYQILLLLYKLVYNFRINLLNHCCCEITHLINNIEL